MKTGLINNFCNGSPISVSASAHEACGPLVTISQSAGSCNFQHDMTANQTRQLVEALLNGIGELERMAIQKAMTAITCEAV